MEQEKRMRREIANSNERRRMQSINAGFQSLRSLLPHQEGEKLSKAAILQQTADFICELDREKSKLVSQNGHLKRLLASVPGSSVSSADAAATVTGNGYTSPRSPAVEAPLAPTVVKRRKTMDGGTGAVESGDEGIGSMSPDHSGSGEESRGELNELRRETMDLRLQLERERRHRVSLEEHIALLQQQQAIYVQKFEQEQVQEVDEVDSGYQPPPAPQDPLFRVIHDETPRCFTIRNNLETIVEAIRHLEGDHLFSDDRNNSSSSSATDSSPEMEFCSSPESHHSQPQQPCSAMDLPVVEIQIPSTTMDSPLVVTAAHSPPLEHRIIIGEDDDHLSQDVAEEVEVEEEPINLEFRPSCSRSPSPELILPTLEKSRSVSPPPPPVAVMYNSQHRRGVIIVKQHS